jgi:hypothetical protein
VGNPRDEDLPAAVAGTSSQTPPPHPWATYFEKSAPAARSPLGRGYQHSEGPTSPVGNYFEKGAPGEPDLRGDAGRLRVVLRLRRPRLAGGQPCREDAVAARRRDLYVDVGRLQVSIPSNGRRLRKTRGCFSTRKQSLFPGAPGLTNRCGAACGKLRLERRSRTARTRMYSHRRSATSIPAV